MTHCNPQQDLTPLQCRVAQQAAKYLQAHVGERVTIQELSRRFHVSPTYLKRSFRLLYGEPVYTWHRRKKMELAADLLCGTSCPILDIANRCGYDNGSKFAAAFRAVWGDTPSGYRQRNSFFGRELDETN